MIDALDFRLYKKDFETFSQHLGDSFSKMGFAVITNHPIEAKLIEEATQKAKDFFALGQEEKKQSYKASLSGQRGYTPMNTEKAVGAKAADLKEFWHHGRESLTIYADLNPDNSIAGFSSTLEALYQRFDGFGKQLLKCLEVYLPLKEGLLTDAVTNGDSILRLLHYPPQVIPPPENALRAEAHEDINAITLLLGAEEGGLQLLSLDGDWLDIKPPKGAIVINIGDMLQRLTHYRLISTTHRVQNPSKKRARFSRYSMPFFQHFSADFLIDPIYNPHTDKVMPEPITAGAYLRERLDEIGL